MWRFMNCCGPVLGRILISQIFLMAGVTKIPMWEETAAGMEEKGMVLVPFFLAAAIAVEIVGGLSVLLGVKARWGALLLFLFLIPVTLIFHGFWQYEGEEMQREMEAFMKNLALMGGLLVLAAFGPGPFSFDERGKKQKKGVGNRE